MRKLMIIASALIMLASCGNAPKEIKIHELEDRDGIAYVAKADKPFTGSAYAYFPDGKTVFAKSDFVDGKQHGEYIEYYQNGTVNYKYCFKNGVEDGEWIWNNEEGQLLKKENYKDGQLNGEWITYYDNGQIRVKGQFENGQEVGEWFAYDEQGNPTER
ncbi:MAG TPA: toxin-antitoxin system YwqK family antitoxin [Tenuifilaceae bacterium]|nr:toxin-antitoxin system YwqK family antitoxin [Tenuifilaceae bacterium]HPD96679.1 toxin-antitoxin system YwqK family antitoxin [Tenuifilaceae bacterium]HPJ46585.1 toxin-antitoxin system YwqK family antitoxin [Tenuifilaceae bacterium]HRX69134.1 toxin-antitoxin system YwqK family antitoxin [Tenuifilaceae bacterium]